MTPEQITIFATTAALIIGQIIQRLDAWRIARSLKEKTDQAAADLKLSTEKAAAEVKAKTEQAADEVKAKMEQQDRNAVEAAADVKNKLEETKADYLLKLEVIRIEGNSKMAAQKKKTMDIARALSTLTGDHDHLAQARLSEGDYHDHMAAQEMADERVRLFVQSEQMKLLEEAKKKANIR